MVHNNPGYLPLLPKHKLNVIRIALINLLLVVLLHGYID